MDRVQSPCILVLRANHNDPKALLVRAFACSAKEALDSPKRDTSGGSAVGQGAPGSEFNEQRIGAGVARQINRGPRPRNRPLFDCPALTAPTQRWTRCRLTRPIRRPPSHCRAADPVSTPLFSPDVPSSAIGAGYGRIGFNRHMRPVKKKTAQTLLCSRQLDNKVNQIRIHGR